jgi:hypothetical protein
MGTRVQIHFKKGLGYVLDVMQVFLQRFGLCSAFHSLLLTVGRASYTNTACQIMLYLCQTIKLCLIVNRRCVVSHTSESESTFLYSIIMFESVNISLQ